MNLPSVYNLIKLDKVNSTNTEAKNYAQKGEEIGPHGTLIWALQQTQGRGRLGKHWDSPLGNLYSSLILRPDISLKNAAQIGFVAALAIYDALGNIGPPGHQIHCKWPNDIFINKKKIAGILIETSVSNNIVTQFIIGIGVNIKSRPNDLKYSSTSLFENELNIKAHNLFFNIIKRLYFFIENYKNIEFLYLSKQLSSRFFNKKSLINVYNGNNKNEGLFSEIGCLGELIIKNKNKNLTIKYGEII